MQTQTSNLPAIQVVNGLAGLKDSLAKTGFSTAQQVATIPLVTAMSKAMKDFALADINWHENSIDVILWGILTQGTPMQRQALAKYTTLETGQYMPCIDIMLKATPSATTKLMAFMQESLKVLAEHYGVSVVGNIESMAYTIINEYGGLSLIDFNTFFEGAKAGRWKGDYQHIASRGINYDYLQGWLEEFSRQRSEANNDAYAIAKHMMNEHAGKVAGGLYEELVKKRQHQEAMEQVVRDAHTEWVSGLSVRSMEPLAVAGVEGDVKTYMTTVVRLTDEGLVRKWKRLVFDYVYFGAMPKNFAVPDAIQMRKQCVEFQNLKSSIKAEEMLFVLLKKKNHSWTDYALQQAAGDTVLEIMASYYDVYLPDCIAQKDSKAAKVYPGLPKNEFVYQTVLKMYSEVFENPFKHIFDV